MGLLPREEALAPMGEQAHPPSDPPGGSHLQMDLLLFRAAWGHRGNAVDHLPPPPGSPGPSDKGLARVRGESLIPQPGPLLTHIFYPCPPSTQSLNLPPGWSSGSRAPLLQSEDAAEGVLIWASVPNPGVTVNPPLGALALFFFLIFIYLWLCWVFVSVRGLSPVASGGHSS